MTLPPILAALRKHKAGVTLITLQIGLTLAIVCNAVFIIGQRVERISRPTGMDEKNLFVIEQMYTNPPAGHDAAAIEKLDAMQRADLATLRGLPDVESAASINTLPLLNAGYSVEGIGLKPNQRDHTTLASLYYVGDEVLKTLGLRLVAGRNFTQEEIAHSDLSGNQEPPLAVVTRALAVQLFPHGDALGKTVYMGGSAMPTTIVGIVARLQTPDASDTSDGGANNSMLLPVRVDSFYTHVVLRARPGRLDAAMGEARKALFDANPMRVMSSRISGLLGVHPFFEIRARAYRADFGMAILMGVICVILLCVTAAGIVGLTSFWVGQRRKQIGIRRALGARRIDILRYFQAENLFIAGGGVVLGAILAVGLNLWLMKQFQMERMSLAYVLVGVVVLLALGQGAVFAPALRASRVSPVEATRSV